VEVNVPPSGVIVGGAGGVAALAEAGISVSSITTANTTEIILVLIIDTPFFDL